MSAKWCPNWCEVTSVSVSPGTARHWRYRDSLSPEAPAMMAVLWHLKVSGHFMIRGPCYWTQAPKHIHMAWRDNPRIISQWIIFSIRVAKLYTGNQMITWKMKCNCALPNLTVSSLEQVLQNQWMVSGIKCIIIILQSYLKYIFIATLL